MRDYFSGWYFRCQSDLQTLAVIPAIHKTGGVKSCSIQLITDTASWNVCFPHSALQKIGFSTAIGDNHFGRHGLHLNLQTPDLTASGTLRFGPFTPLRYDIMGPFRFLPFMECRHSVLSMKHSVTGELNINGTTYSFQNAAGYLEGDRGRSFPREYAWTQCSFPDGALMLAVADIPWCGHHFTGVIGVILWQGKEYRIATYLGAKVLQMKNGQIIVQQGSSRLTVKQLAHAPRPLYAPTGGAMKRTIHEHAACRVFFSFEKKEHTLFAFEAPNAAFEYEYPC